jgi:hypothetical protein
MSEYWLEQDLARGLRPVIAPDELWSRIEHGPVVPLKPSSGRIWWLAAAAVALLMAGVTAKQMMRPRNVYADMQALAARELDVQPGDSQPLDFRSADPAAIQAWVKEKTNLTVSLPAGNAAIQLLGARVVDREGAPTVAVAYKIGDACATLFVSHSSPSSQDEDHIQRRHKFVKLVSSRGGVFSWSMREQTYTLASAGKTPKVACVLCHVGPESVTSLN